MATGNSCQVPHCRKVPVSAGILWCAHCGVARQNEGNKPAPIQKCNKCAVIYCNTQCATKYYPSHVCIPDQADATTLARDRGDQIIQGMADQLAQEMVTDEASDSWIVAEQAELVCRQPALRTIDIIKGEERKRLATVAMQTLNNHSQAETKAKNANHGSILSNSAFL